jgi:hypothetical protein
MGTVTDNDETGKYIPLGHTGKFALVDAADYEWLTQWKWYHCGAHTGYAKRPQREGKRRLFLYMHRIIVGAPQGMLVDHINHNTLDNRRANLRLVTPSQNRQNTRKVVHYREVDPLSTYKGIQRNGRGWRATIEIQGTRVMGQSYTDPSDAARDYDRLARQHFGEHAHLNFRDDNHA